MKEPFILICFFSLFIFSGTSAQETSVKLYSNFYLFNSRPLPVTLSNPYDEFSFNNLSIAFREITKREWVHEIEGSYASTDVGYAESKAYNIRYALGKYLWRSKNQKARFLLSGASRLFYQRSQIVSTGDNLNNIINDVGLNLSLFTHLEFDLSKKFYLDINASILGMTLSRQSWKQGPLQGELQSFGGEYNFNALNERLLRIGVGFRF